MLKRQLTIMTQFLHPNHSRSRVSSNTAARHTTRLSPIREPAMTDHNATTPVLYFNPDCSKCRNALDLLRRHGIEPILRHYLQQPLDQAEVRAIITRLDQAAGHLLRPDRAAALGLEPTTLPSLAVERVVALLVEHPDLLQRPVVVVSDRAWLARPPERVLELLDR